MKAAGIGGVEINSIAFPAESIGDTLGLKQIEWLSPEWLQMVEVAAKGAKERDMYADLIVGSGWPFGGEFLSRDEQIKMIALQTRELKGPAKVEVDMAELFESSTPKLHANYDHKLVELVGVRLVPKVMDKFTAGTEVPFDAAKGTFTIDVPKGEYVAYYTIKFTGYMAVIHGSMGARGPVLDHYNRAAVEHFLYRMSDALKSVFGQIGDYIRSFFTDSLELEGANWSDDFLDEFQTRRGYDLQPYMPFVLKKIGHMGDALKEEYGCKFSPEVQEELNRVRYDWDITLTELFKERFLDVMIAWCREHGVMSRMQAYGRGYIHVESNLEVDIPEGETWYNNAIGVQFPNTGPKGRGYLMCNKFVSSGAHLGGKRVVSCEENTNTAFVFAETLERMKLSSDLSTLSGITHAILHGFNYSPPETAFPGWIRYGAYWSERNPIWKHFPLWAQYKARLSAVLMNADMQCDIAIMHPIADLWTNFGTQRDPFPGVTYPHYADNLWECINQNGSGAEYISEGILQRASFRDGTLNYGPCSYRALMLMEVETLQPATLTALEAYAKAGGLVILIGKQPCKAPGLKGMGEQSAQIAARMNAVMEQYPERIVRVEPPGASLLDWYRDIQKRFNLTPYVTIDQPQRQLSQLYYRTGPLDIFFFSNYNMKEGYDISACFNIDLKGRRAWIWDCETGERRLLPETDNTLALHFMPGESKLIVFDKPGKASVEHPFKPGKGTMQESLWNITFDHYDGTRSRIEDSKPFDLLLDERYKSFSGEITYETILTGNGYSHLEFGVKNCISELWVNDVRIGVVWYGRHVYEVAERLKPGDNQIKLVLTTNLINYVQTLTENPVAMCWTSRSSNNPMPCGMVWGIKTYAK